MPTRDEHIAEADRQITGQLSPLLLQGADLRANADNWWETRTALVEIEYLCHLIIGIFDDARYEEEIEQGKRQRFQVKTSVIESNTIDKAPSLEDLGL